MVINHLLNGMTLQENANRKNKNNETGPPFQVDTLLVKPTPTMPAAAPPGLKQQHIP